MRDTLIDRKTWVYPQCPICHSITRMISCTTEEREYSCSKRHFYVTYGFDRKSSIETEPIIQFLVINKYFVTVAKASTTQYRTVILDTTKGRSQTPIIITSPFINEICSLEQIENFLILT